MKVSTYHPTTATHTRSWKGIAQHLTGTDLVEMAERYHDGKGHIPAPRGHKITRVAFEELCSYLNRRDLLHGGIHA